MENLTPEGKAVYESIAIANEKAHEKFKAEIRLLIAASIADSVDSVVDRALEKAMDKAVDKAVTAKVNSAISTMQAYTDGVEDDLRASMGLASHDDDSAHRFKPPRGDAETGPDGCRATPTTRGQEFMGSQPYVPPPARGITGKSLTLAAGSSRVANSFSSLFNREQRANHTHHGKPPSMDFPKFDGHNPKLWQTRCQDYFNMFDTDPEMWIAVAGMQFEGEAAQWLSSVQHQFSNAEWPDFCSAVLHRFGKNQHQSLVRKLYRLRQTATVKAYVRQFASLMDQLSAYEPNPDMLHYTTRFIDGLKHDVRLIVAVQRPVDLNTAYTIALVQEEVCEDEPEYCSSNSRRPQSSSSSRSARQLSFRNTEELRSPDSSKSTVPADDKLATLKAYRRAKGLCYICGEK